MFSGWLCVGRATGKSGRDVETQEHVVTGGKQAASTQSRGPWTVCRFALLSLVNCLSFILKYFNLLKV